MEVVRARVRLFGCRPTWPLPGEPYVFWTRTGLFTKWNTVLRTLWRSSLERRLGQFPFISSGRTDPGKYGGRASVSNGLELSVEPGELIGIQRASGSVSPSWLICWCGAKNALWGFDGLGPHLDLCGEHRQRVALGVPLKLGAFMIRDEPTNYMRALLEGRVMTRLIEWEGDRTCLIVFHGPSVLARVDRMLTLQDGRLSFCIIFLLDNVRTNYSAGMGSCI